MIAALDILRRNPKRYKDPTPDTNSPSPRSKSAAFDVERRRTPIRIPTIPVRVPAALAHDFCLRIEYPETRPEPPPMNRIPTVRANAEGETVETRESPPNATREIPSMTSSAESARSEPQSFGLGGGAVPRAATGCPALFCEAPHSGQNLTPLCISLPHSEQ